VPIRLELSALALETDSGSGSPTAAVPNVCPQNWVRQNGKCTRTKPSVSHQCRTEDVADCKTECERNDAASCVNYGFALERGMGTKRDVATAAAQYLNACRLGSGLGCHNLGYLYANGLGVARDEKKAVELYRQACEAGEPRGCNSLGAAYFAGQGVPKDRALARRWLTAACNGGLGEACANLGSLLLTQGLDQAKAASQLFQRACDAPSGLGCAALAGSYEFGLGVSKDLKRAMSLSQRACGLGNTLGCVSTASYYAAGKGVSPNEERAHTLFEETCERGELLACALLKTAYHESRELKPAELNLYTDTWEPTCQAGFVGDCTSLGILYLGSNRSEDGAKLLRQSCTAGDTFACWVQQRR
jgi:TPR repeat protein